MCNVKLIISNILKVTFRNKGNIIIYLFLPLFGVILSMIIYGTTSSPVLNIGMANKDKGEFSVDLKKTFEESDSYKVIDVSEEEIKDKLLEHDIDVAVIIPENYTESIYSGEPEKIQLTSIKGESVTAWVRSSIQSYTDSLAKLSDASSGNKNLFDMMYQQYKQETIKVKAVKLTDVVTGRSMTLTSVGFLILFIMLGSNTITMLILKEKRDRTYHRICSAPVKARQYILANAISCLLVSMTQIILIQLSMKILEIDSGIAAISLFFILLLFSVVSVGLSLMLVAFSDSSYMASTLGTLVITTTCMLGGCYWDIKMMPDFMQKAAYFVPQSWAMEAIGKMQRDGSISDIGGNLIILAAFAAAFFLIAIYKFAKSKNVQKFV